MGDVDEADDEGEARLSDMRVDFGYAIRSTDSQQALESSIEDYTGVARWLSGIPSADDVGDEEGIASRVASTLQRR